MPRAGPRFHQVGDLTPSNFSACAMRYMNNVSLIAWYNYSGPVKLIPRNESSQITFAGCVALCGSGSEWYPWTITSATITTWVLPIVGTLLQAPFESNAFWRTVKATNRWMGSPIASLACILWNIKVSGKCALYVDMATRYEDPIPSEGSDFASLRDSFYILMNTNQYKMKPVISMTREAEGLLRIVLFSKDLKLLSTDKTLVEMRGKLARELRENRRRGVVPVFISTLWFVVSLAISIEAAFGELGSNSQAHNLAMGLFLSWFPVLILCSILDRNPVASDNIQRKLNKMIDRVCVSLQDEKTRSDYIASFSDLPQAQQMAHWLEKVTAKTEYIKGDFFCSFAGQARTRFHYGAAHAILTDIERSYLAEHGRNWLADTRGARGALVLGQVHHGFVWFDGRQLWQVVSAIAIVVGTSAGGFVLSYTTPTVGLGCHSGGYLVFIIASVGLLLTELLVWWYTSPMRKKDRFDEHINQFIRRRSSDPNAKTLSFPGVASSQTLLARLLRYIEDAIIYIALICIRILPLHQKAVHLRDTEAAIRHHFEELRNLTLRNWFQRAFFTPLEFANTIWLCYLVIAQTFGSFNNCTCMSSTWGSGGGYVDFAHYDNTSSPLVRQYWIEATAVACAIMALGNGYIVLEWLLQAHISTENYHDATVGLRRVRRFRRFTQWIRYPSALLVLFINNALHTCRIRKTSKQEVLVWSKESRYQPHLADAAAKLAIVTMQQPFGRMSSEEASQDNEKRTGISLAEGLAEPSHTSLTGNKVVGDEAV